jgi:DNA repair protein RecO (recombination protein O)
LDKGNDTLTGNLPLYFTLHLGSELGFQLHGKYSSQTPVLDLQEGMFIAEKPSHPYYLEDDLARITSELSDIKFYNDLENIQLNRSIRRELLQAYQTYLALHIHDFGEMRSFAILQEILS